MPACSHIENNKDGDFSRALLSCLQARVRKLSFYIHNGTITSFYIQWSLPNLNVFTFFLIQHKMSVSYFVNHEIIIISFFNKGVFAVIHLCFKSVCAPLGILQWLFPVVTYSPKALLLANSNILWLSTTNFHFYFLLKFKSLYFYDWFAPTLLPKITPMQHVVINETF